MSIQNHKTSFLVFSDDFGEHPTSCQHLFLHLPEKHPVLWVNTIGMRLPRLTFRDFQKAMLKSKKMIGYSLKKNVFRNTFHNNINVCQPPMLPFLNIPGIRALNKYSICRSVKNRLATLQMQSPVVVATAPNACDYFGLFGEQRKIYYCVDDYAEWPGLEKKLVQNMEKELIRKSDILIATSQNLFDRLSDGDKQVYLLTHGVDVDLFLKTPEAEHSLLKKIPKPRVGYFGLFDERSDQKLIIDLANMMPDVSLVITGNVETDISKLSKCHNLYFTGSVPYNELPAIVKGWDVCILPYKVNKLTDSIQPLKLKEYLASGKPVISTPIKEACLLDDVINISHTVEEWEKSIREFFNGTQPEVQERRNLFLEKESWTSKAEQFFSICINPNSEKQ